MLAIVPFLYLVVSSFHLGVLQGGFEQSASVKVEATHISFHIERARVPGGYDIDGVMGVMGVMSGVRVRAMEWAQHDLDAGTLDFRSGNRYIGYGGSTSFALWFFGSRGLCCFFPTRPHQ